MAVDGLVGKVSGVLIQVDLVRLVSEWPGCSEGFVFLADESVASPLRRGIRLRAECDEDDINGTLILSCIIDGDDLIITNKGDPIPPGTKVKWAANGEHGTVQLTNGLNAGQKAKIENVLDGGAGKCSAEVVL